MITEAKGKLFRIIGGRVLYAEDVADGAGYYELRGDRAWEISVGPSQKPGQVTIHAQALNASFWGTTRVKLFKSALQAVETISENSVVYKTVVQARSKIQIAPAGALVGPQREQ